MWRGTLGFGFDTASRAIFGLVFIAFATRSLDLVTFGQLSFVLAIVAVQFSLVGYGLPALVYGRSSRATEGKVAALFAALRIAGALGLATYMITAAILWLLAPDLLPIYLLAGLRVLSGFSQILTAFYEARHRVGAYVPIRAAINVALIIVLATNLAFPFDVTAFALIWGLEFLLFAAGLTIYGLRASDISRKVRAGYTRSLMISSWPLLVQSLTIVIYYRFDQLYIGWRFGAEDLGLYAAATKIAEAGNFLWMIVVLTIAPTTIRSLRSRGRLPLRSSLSLLLIGAGTISVAALASIWGGPLLSVLFTPDYAAAQPILAIYLLSTMFVAYGSFASRVLAAHSVQGPQAISGTVGAVTNVVLTILFSEWLGLVGAAIATVVAYAAASGILVVVAARKG